MLSKCFQIKVQILVLKSKTILLTRYYQLRGKKLEPNIVWRLLFLIQFCFYFWVLWTTIIFLCIHVVQEVLKSNRSARKCPLATQQIYATINFLSQLLMPIKSFAFCFPYQLKGAQTWSAGYLEVGHIASMITLLTREIKVTKFHSQPPGNHTYFRHSHVLVRMSITTTLMYS